MPYGTKYQPMYNTTVRNPSSYIDRNEMTHDQKSNIKNTQNETHSVQLAVLDASSRFVDKSSNAWKPKSVYTCRAIHSGTEYNVMSSVKYTDNMLVTISVTGADANVITIFGDTNDPKVINHAMFIYGNMDHMSKLKKSVTPVAGVASFTFPAFTIDPVGTKVFDDAFTITHNMIGVHISDMSYANVSAKNNTNYKAGIYEGARKPLYSPIVCDMHSLSQNKTRSVLSMWYNRDTHEVTFSKSKIRVTHNYTYSTVSEIETDPLCTMIDELNLPGDDIDSKYYYPIDNSIKLTIFKIMYIYSQRFYMEMYKRYGYVIVRNPGGRELYFNVERRNITTKDVFEFVTSPLRCLYASVIQRVMTDDSDVGNVHIRLDDELSRLNMFKHRYTITHSTLNSVSRISKWMIESSSQRKHVQCRVSRVYEGCVIVIINNDRHLIDRRNITFTGLDLTPAVTPKTLQAMDISPDLPSTPNITPNVDIPIRPNDISMMTSSGSSGIARTHERSSYASMYEDTLFGIDDSNDDDDHDLIYGDKFNEGTIWTVDLSLNTSTDSVINSLCLTVR